MKVRRGVEVAVVVAVVALAAGIVQEASGQQGFQSMLHHLSPPNNDMQPLNYCRISTRDLIGITQNAVNRVLQGVCNPREVEERFKSLETQIVEQFNVLKTMVLNIEDKLLDQDEQVKRQHRKLQRSVASLRALGSSMQITEKSDGAPLPEGDYFEDYPEEDEEQETSWRQAEVEQYNSTIHQEEGRRVFTYYWAVADLDYKMNNWGWRRSLRSNNFYIFQYGYNMYMRVYPNHNGENVYIHVGLTKGDYDEALDWPFQLLHKVAVLDHVDPPEDIRSRVWDPRKLCSGWNWKRPDGGDNYECVGLGFPQELLSTRRYILGGTIIIKLTVYLD
ncbi:uncharacterized protein LOC143029175 isoform X2 [Oratosquilla oratoria]|uniref:uncharacterized protein LOC143029175 isoform X2 n=1 Tax=Oratosquilla oratoria TaxID=337810 RepID=UPI003F764DC0